MTAIRKVTRPNGDEIRVGTEGIVRIEEVGIESEESVYFAFRAFDKESYLLREFINGSVDVEYEKEKGVSKKGVLTDKGRELLRDFLYSLRAYEREAGSSIGFDEREDVEFISIYEKDLQERSKE